MNAVSLKELNLAALLPKYLNDSLLCFAFVLYKVVDGGPDIVTCNTNGYMYEIKNKHILRCLNLHCNATSVSCYYLTENEKTVIFYLVLTSANRLLIIKRASKHLEVVEAYENVKEFQVYDFECTGFPQIKITFIDDYGNQIYNFPVEPHVEAKFDENASSMVESLTEELQMLYKHIDDLSEGYNHLRKICGVTHSQAGFDGVVVGPVKFSSSLIETVEHKLVVCDKWHKVYGKYLILGMRLHNVGNEIVNNIAAIINHKRVKNYFYSFYEQPQDLLFDSRKLCTDVKPGEKIFAVGAFSVPEFFVDSKFSVCFYVTSPDLKDSVVKEVFDVDVLDIAGKSTAGLEERFTVEDLMAIMTIKSETRVKIETEDLEENSLESMLIKNLGFTKINGLKDKLFYCTSTYLNEVFVSLRHVAAGPSIWIVVMYTSDSSQIYFLINALYDLLPDNTSISHHHI